MNLPNISATRLVSIDTSRITTMVAPILAIIVSILVLFFIVWPKFTNVLALRSANRGLEVRVKNLESKAQLLSQLDKVEQTSDLGHSEQLLPSDKGVFSVIRQIEVSAGVSGVVLNRVDVTPGSLSSDDSSSAGNTQPGAKTIETADAAPKIQLKIALTSDYNSFLNFIANLYSAARVTSVRDLTFSSSASPGQTAPLRTNLIINAYWKPLPTKLGQLESPVSKLTDSEVARLEKVESATSSAAVVVPQVPIGRSDLFAPF